MTPSARLAIDGGTPVLSGPAPVWPRPDDAVRAALDRAYADGSWGRYHGPNCTALVEALAAMHQVEHVTLCCSGTFAVELALRALKIEPGDEVVLAGYDFPGNFRAIEAVGARPVLVDIEPDSWCLNVDQLEQALQAETRAIIVSHLHGTLADMPRIMQIARARGVSVVEDACQAPGATIAGRPVGSWGDVGVLSFGGSKLLTAGRGGALLTPDAEAHQRAKLFCERGNQAFPLSELQAAVLLPQLQKLESENFQRQQSVDRLLARTADLAPLQRLATQRPMTVASYYKLGWRYVTEMLRNTSIERFVAAIQAEGVPLNTGFRGFTRRTQRRCRKVGQLEQSLIAANVTVILHHPILLEPLETMDLIAVALRKVCEGLSS